VSLTATFVGSKVRQTIICENSKILYYLQKKCRVMGISVKIKSITWFRFFIAQDLHFSKKHKTDTKVYLAKTKIGNLWVMILNNKLNCQVSTIFMNPRLIHVETLREWMTQLNYSKPFFARYFFRIFFVFFSQPLAILV
jgi:hypothetical protein